MKHKTRNLYVKGYKEHQPLTWVGIRQRRKASEKGFSDCTSELRNFSNHTQCEKVMHEGGGVRRGDERLLKENYSLARHRRKNIEFHEC